MEIIKRFHNDIVSSLPHGISIEKLAYNLLSGFKDMDLIIHRGSHEIGGSCLEIQEGSARIIFDIGMPLSDRSGGRFNFSDYRELPGSNLVEKGILPDIDGLYPWDESGNRIDAIVLSHSHMDHFGFVHYARNDIPVFVGEASYEIIKITTRYFGSPEIKSSVAYFRSQRSFKVREVTITPFLVDHSAFDAYAFVVESPTKKLIYSGDFRRHGRKPGAYKCFLDDTPKNADALILEGTTLGRENFEAKAEWQLEDEIVNLVKDSGRMVLFTCSGQNIDRLVGFYRASLRTDRILVIDPYTAIILDTLKDFASIPYPSANFRNLRVLFSSRISSRLKKMFGEEILWRFKSFKITRQEISNSPQKVIMMVRTSMMRELNRIENMENALFIYSMWKGYLEDKSMAPLMELIQARGMDFRQIHTSGHASFNTLKETVKTLKPKRVIPIHTQRPDLFSKLGCPVTILSDRERYSL